MKKIIIIVLIIVGAGAFYAWYLFNKPVAETINLKSELTVSASELFSEYELDEAAANEKYLGKIIEVSGVVNAITSDEKGMNLMMNTDNDFFGINCAMSPDQQEKLNNYKQGDQIKIKGECSGFISDVVLVRCIVVE